MGDQQIPLGLLGLREQRVSPPARKERWETIAPVYNARPVGRSRLQADPPNPPESTCLERTTEPYPSMAFSLHRFHASDRVGRLQDPYISGRHSMSTAEAVCLQLDEGP